MDLDILALSKIVELVEEFSNKNIISKDKINFIKIKEKINDLKSKQIDDVSKSEQFKNFLKKLKTIIARDLHSKIYFIIGGHGGVIIEDLGFCEFDSPEFALNRLLEKMQLAIKTRMPYNLEIATCCLEWLKKNQPKGFSKFLELFTAGRFEIINPSYSQPYSLIIGPESNIKQFEFGLKVLKKLGLKSEIYYCSEVSLHPQIPQILRGFDIKHGSLRTRLLGSCPTTKSGMIDWVGLDGTKIPSMTDQSGIYNGEYWHGTFFKEIPNLLFQAVSRPFMPHIFFSSIEDFIMPQPYQDETWRISEHSEIFGKFVLCSELFQQVEKDGEYKYSHDDFSLGDYVYIANHLYINNKACENKIISAEILNCILGFFGEASSDSFLDGMWKKLLLTQAHDNYAVPFMRSGDYSALQLSKEEFSKLKLPIERVSISELSLRLQKEIQDECTKYISNCLLKISEFLKKDSEKSTENYVNLLVFNPLPFPRRDFFSIQLELKDPSGLTLSSNEEIDFEFQNSKLKFISEIPSFGYKIYSLKEKKQTDSKSAIKRKFFYNLKISEDAKAIEIIFNDEIVFTLKFQSNFEYKLHFKESYGDNIENTKIIMGESKDKTFKVMIRQYSDVNRLEFKLFSNIIREIVLLPKIKIEKYYVNYPFGIEETRRSKIQSLDFMWLEGIKDGILFMQRNSQQFIIDREKSNIRNVLYSGGVFEFAIVKTSSNEHDDLLNHVNSYYTRFLGIKIDNSREFAEKVGSFLSITPILTVTNLWRRKNHSYIRILNSSNMQKTIKLSGPIISNEVKEIDFNYNELRTIENAELMLEPWKIKSLALFS